MSIISVSRNFESAEYIYDRVAACHWCEEIISSIADSISTQEDENICTTWRKNIWIEETSQASIVVIGLLKKDIDEKTTHLALGKYREGIFE